MHEIGMCESVLAAVERRAEGREVAEIGVRAGAMLRVEPEAFAQGFELVAAGTVADGATTAVTTVPLEATCRDCGTDLETIEPTPACPDCGGVSLERHNGNELTLEWIRYHEPVADVSVDTTEGGV